MLIASGLLLAALTAGVSADEGVGLEARGVSPYAALQNRHGLDVRDAFNRPVSREAVERDLKRISAASAAGNAFASRLPHARRVLPLLELLAAIKAGISSGLKSLTPSAVWGLAPSRVSLKIVFALALLTGALIAQSSHVRPVAASPRPASDARHVILRC